MLFHWLLDTNKRPHKTKQGKVYIYGGHTVQIRGILNCKKKNYKKREKWQGAAALMRRWHFGSSMCHCSKDGKGISHPHPQLWRGDWVSLPPAKPLKSGLENFCPPQKNQGSRIWKAQRLPPLPPTSLSLETLLLFPNKRKSKKKKNLTPVDALQFMRRNHASVKVHSLPFLSTSRKPAVPWRKGRRFLDSIPT